MNDTTHLRDRIVLPSPDSPDSPDSGGSVMFIGTASLLIRYAGLTVLTDPNFVHMHEKVDIGYGMTATRLTDPALDIGELPPIDLIVLSHFHGDHFDQVAERELDKSLPIVTTDEAVKALTERGFMNLHPLEPWDELSLEKGDARLRITATPGRHGPPVVSVALPDVIGTILDFETVTEGTGQRLYITGDTLVIDDLKEIPQRFPDIDLAMLHLGGGRVLGMLVTMDGEQGVELLRIVEPKVAIPIHYDDYDVFKSPLSEFRAAVEAAGLSEGVRYLRRGESYVLGT